jgi:hypothetical protein
MFGLDNLDTLFVLSAFSIQGVLLVHFALRKWVFDTAMRFGWIVYALCVPMAALSIALWVGGKPWYFWLAGVLYTAWALFGFTVEIILKITDWRSPIRWPVFIPYVGLYLASLMFFWWPLGLISRPFWYGYALLFVASTVLNLTSHKRRGE